MADKPKKTFRPTENRGHGNIGSGKRRADKKHIDKKHIDKKHIDKKHSGSHPSDKGARETKPHLQEKWSANPRAEQPAFRLTTKDSYLVYGRNAVVAAVTNPDRDCIRLIATDRALKAFDAALIPHRLRVETLSGPEAVGSHVPTDAPHQGLFLEVRPLPGIAVADIAPIDGRKNIILMLDQVTDPQNVGACLRSAAAFGARALVTQDRNSPSESGVLARASAGGLELVPWVRAANLAQTLSALKDMGYWSIGLDGHTDTMLKSANVGDNIVIVMGSEGKGLRPLVRKHCDMIVKIPMSGTIESLNVSNAAAIALYEFGS